jgi:hypothetical protein
MNRYDRAFTVELSDRDDYARAERILAAAVLQINDRVAGLYAGQAAPENVSELERPNYG